ncbi:Maf family protein [Sphingosinicella microcystinivorans]|uniref:Maf family protein n=1 Tax=Sphingosinicella microcystinivorans TaxID=335406 RepID=UPI0022F3ED9A|nr:nucleoside triphosphate pyrophosphatase [Sphingosinicella microcystinivorans]WBX85334.1 Maf family protein [Sphingosinicella microcystinivorans]
MPALVLASSSPRRRALLEQIGLVPARTLSPDIDETPRRGELPRDYAVRLAAEKAAAVPRGPGEAVIAGDTTVAAGRRILPPADTDDVVRQCLALLSGRRHRVYSAVAVIDADGRLRGRVAESIVAFKRLSAAEIDAYVRSGEGRGKAGGYAIQGRAAAFVRFLSGSYSGVVGLPLYEAAALLAASGIVPSDG